MLPIVLSKLIFMPIKRKAVLAQGRPHQHHKYPRVTSRTVNLCNISPIVKLKQCVSPQPGGFKGRKPAVSTTSQHPLSPSTTRKGWFIQLPLEVLIDSRLSAGAKLFLAHLLRWDWGNGCWLTDKQLARELGISVRSIRNHTKALEEAGYLWIFKNREGMAVRLVVRPGHVYPKPRSFGKPLERKNFSRPATPNMVFNHNFDLEVHETTTDHQIDPVLEEAIDQEREDAVVTIEPQKLTRETPDEPLETVTEREEEILTPNPLDRAIEVLQDAGIAAPVAQVLACRHSAGRIRATVTYAEGYCGELLNKSGYVVSALQNGWELPKWCYRPEPAKNDTQKQPSETRSLPALTPEIPREPASPVSTPDPVIVEAMVNAGVARMGAVELARKYPAIRCWDGVAYVQKRLIQGDPILNPGGYIRRAIEEGWKAFTGESLEKLLEDDSGEKAEEKSHHGQSPEDRISPPVLLFGAEEAHEESPYAGIWEKALEAMQDLKNLDVWINPHAVSLYLRQAHIDRIEEGSACLVAPACAAACIQDYTEEIKGALRLAGMEVEAVAVTVKEDVELGCAEGQGAPTSIAPHLDSYYIS